MLYAIELARAASVCMFAQALEFYEDMDRLPGTRIGWGQVQSIGLNNWCYSGTSVGTADTLEEHECQP